MRNPQEKNWWEFRFRSKQPERRAYHSTFEHQKKMYIFGGKDLGVGHLDTLWSIDLSEIGECRADEEIQIDAEWNPIATKGNHKPEPISHHTSVVHLDTMYLFGGSHIDQENLKMYTLDLNNLMWKVVKPKAKDGDESNLPVTRDEHSCVLHHDSMVIFGGFIFGERTNDIFKYHFESNTWEKMVSESQKCPIPRVGHSAVVFYDEAEGDKMFIFGGKDDENNKLCDLWSFNFKTKEWEEV